LTHRILVLGAAGRLGYVAAEAFRDAGWIVTSLVRPGGAARAPTGTEIVEGDALDHQAVAAAARGVPIILHALNASYTKWYVSSYRYSRRRVYQYVFWVAGSKQLRARDER